jgi:hypothetical protein
MKTNREKNLEHDTKVQNKVRPKGPTWDWQPLSEALQRMAGKE